MKKQKWLCKMLSGILCASLVIQSLSVTTYASELMQVEETRQEMESEVLEATSVEETVVEEVMNEEEIPEEVITEDKTVEESVTEEVTSEEVTTKENITEESVTRENVTEELTTEEGITEKNTTEELTTEEEMTEENTTEELTIEEGVTEENTTEELTTEKSVTEENMTEELTTEEVTTEETSVDELACAESSIELLLEEKYYIYSTGTDIYVQLKGYESNSSEELKFYIDNSEVEFKSESYYNQTYFLENSKLKAGTHKIKVELWNGNTKIEETEEYSFQIVKQNIFPENEKVYMAGDTSGDFISSVTVDVLSINNTGIKKVQMVNQNGKVYAETNYEEGYIENGFEVYGDPRYKIFNNSYIGKLYWYSPCIHALYNTTPAGNYHVKLEFEDGTTEEIKNAVVVTSTSETTVINCFLGSDYDNTGDYIYLCVAGKNIEPEKLNYTISQNDKNYPVTYVNHKKMYSGELVKLKKSGWTKLGPGSGKVTISGKDGYQIVPSKFSSEVYISSGIFYLEYNPVTKKVEAAFSTDTDSNNKKVNVAVRLGWNKEENPVVAKGSATISNGVAYIDLYNLDGSRLVPKTGNYYFDFTVSDKIYEESIWINGESEYSAGAGYWSNPSAILKGTKTVYCYYFTGMEYSGKNKEASSYTAKVTGNNLKKPIVVTADNNRLFTYDSNNQVAVGMSFDLSSLAEGNYKVTVYKGGKELSSSTLLVKSSDKFIVDYIGATWTSDLEISLYVSTPFCSESDAYKVTLTDADGKVVPGITTSVRGRYGDAVSLSIRGLKYANAAKKYYIKITHKTLGEAYDWNGNAFASDNRGKLTEIDVESIGYSTKDNRIVGLYLSSVSFPLQVKFYKPYTTELIKEISVDNKSELVDESYYYFDKTFYDSLPSKNDIYEMVIIENDKRVTFIHGVLGYLEKQETVDKLWEYEIDKTKLFINVDKEKEATISVTNSKKKPVYKSSDTNVVTIKADTDNPEKAVITAVGLGVAEISITADGITKKFTITVERQNVITELMLNRTELIMNVEDNQELVASVLPAEAWAEGQKITFSSSDKNVVKIVENIDNAEKINTVSLIALKSGTAVITAKLDGTNLTASCKVTVRKEISKEEQLQLTSDIETKSVLVNRYKNNAVTLKDIELPEGWSWEDDSIRLVADDALPIQQYLAIYEKEGYESFSYMVPVAVSELIGVSVVGDSAICPDDYKDYEIVCKYKGYQDAWEYMEDLEYQCTAAGKDPMVRVENNGDWTFGIWAADFAPNTIQPINVVVKVKDNNKKSFKTTFKLNITSRAYIEYIVIEPWWEPLETEVMYEYDNGTIMVDRDNISTVKGEVMNTICLAALPDGCAEEVYKSNIIKWTTSDSSVAAIRVTKDSRYAVITVKKAGTATIRAMATDGGKCMEELVVNVIDYAPIMDANKMTVSMYDTVGTMIPVRPQNGNTITGIRILEKGEESDKFVVEQSDYGYVAKLYEEFSTNKNMTVKAVLQLETDNGMEYEKNITITIDAKKKPTATLKQTSKANLFYTDAAAAFAVTSKYEIEDIVDITESDEPRFHAYYDKDKKELVVNTNHMLNQDTLALFKNKKSSACKLKLKVTFAGYTDAASQVINVTVATEDKKPSFKLNDITLMPGMNTSITEIVDTKTKDIYELESWESIRVISDNSKTNDVTAAKVNNTVAITYDGNKNVTYTAELISEKWTQPLKMSGKVTVAKTQNMVLSSSKIILNTAHNIQQNGSVAIDVALKNNDTAIKKISYTIDQKNEKLFRNGYLSIRYSAATQRMYVGLNKDCRGDIKAGTYKVNICGAIMVGEQEVALKAVPLTITLVDKTPAVTLSGKGSIDLLRRTNTCMVYTPKIANVTASLKSVKVTGTNAAYFRADLDDGKVKLYAIPEASLSTKKTYPVKLHLTLDNGCQLTTIVNVKPVSKEPKIIASADKITLYKLYRETENVKIAVNDENVAIKEIRFVDGANNEYMEFLYDENQKHISVALIGDTYRVKPGKYTISYQVYLKDAAYDAKPITKKLTVTIK